jgi:hypothetical protein
MECMYSRLWCLVLPLSECVLLAKLEKDRQHTHQRIVTAVGWSKLLHGSIDLVFLIVITRWNETRRVNGRTFVLTHFRFLRLAVHPLKRTGQLLLLLAWSGDRTAWGSSNTFIRIGCAHGWWRRKKKRAAQIKWKRESQTRTMCLCTIQSPFLSIFLKKIVVRPHLSAPFHFIWINMNQQAHACWSLWSLYNNLFWR